MENEIVVLNAKEAEEVKENLRQTYRNLYHENPSEKWLDRTIRAMLSAMLNK